MSTSKTKEIHIVKVVSKNVFSDMYSQIQNVFGSNLTPYESMLNKGIMQIWQEVGCKKLKWYRLECAPISKNATIILFYGELS